MRLLRRESLGFFTSSYDFRLTSFVPRDIPPYAILSHRWGADEVTIKDIEDGTLRTRTGYKKLDFCAEQAAIDGLVYFWIDTCCIDKTSSAELSEAINSMFKWYQNATKCYVYLPDVVYGPQWETTFQHSEWFDRGWTLQELIAPSSVEFFSSDGKKLGNKTSLEQQIHQTTGIPVEVLRGKPLHQIDPKERLSWTIRRQTTVEEDTIYCLLGIFDIHMSLIYGEGHRNALARLQRKIDKSLQNSSPVFDNVVWIVPFERNSNFAGRESHLAELERKLFAQEHTSKIAITGLGGVGKTQLVLELLFRTREKHQKCSIMWIAATSKDNLLAGFRYVAQQLKIPGCNETDADVVDLVRDYLSKEDAGQWLLVFDNTDDIDLWTSPLRSEQKNSGEAVEASMKGHPRLIDCLPQNKQGCIIFTTRDRKAAAKLAEQNIVLLSEMSEIAATQLLKNSLADHSLFKDSNDTTALLAALTYLPLAIVQATAYINANGVTLADYASFIEDKEEDTIEILSEDFEDYGRYHSLKNPVATTWLVSFERIRQSDPLAAEYMSFIACISPREIPQSLLPPGASRKKELDAIGTLIAYSFIRRRSMSTVFDVHRLVHLAMRNWLRRENLLGYWTEVTIRRIEDVFPDSDHKNRSFWRAYLPHAIRALSSDLVSQDENQRMTLMVRCGTCLYSDGRWSEAERLFDEVLSILRKEFGDNIFPTLSIMAGLAIIYRDQGHWAKAEQFELQILETRKVKYGLDHVSTATGMANLASTYRMQKRWKEAEQLETHVLAVRKAKLGADHPHTLISMGNLATVYTGQDRIEEAEGLEVQVMETRKTKLGIEHPDTLISMVNLAGTYQNQKRWKEAQQLEMKVLEARNATLGADHPDTLNVVNNLAITLKGLGRDTEAMHLMKDCVQRRARMLGDTHYASLVSLETLRTWEAEAEHSTIDDVVSAERNRTPDNKSL